MLPARTLGWTVAGSPCTVKDVRLVLYAKLLDPSEATVVGMVTVVNWLLINAPASIVVILLGIVNEVKRLAPNAYCGMVVTEGFEKYEGRDVI